MKVATGFVPIIGHEHPAGRLVDREDGAVFVKNGDGGAIGEDDFVAVAAGVRTRHEKSLRNKLPVHTNKGSSLRFPQESGSGHLFVEWKFRNFDRGIFVAEVGAGPGVGKEDNLLAERVFAEAGAGR